MKKLAILGASKPHLPLFTKAKRMGIETFCFAWNEGAYCKDFADHFFDISIIDKESIAEKCKENHIDGIVSNALEIAVPTAAYVAEHLHLNGIPYSVALDARNKYQMREKVSKYGVSRQPSYVLYSNGYTPTSYPIIVKPVDGSCSNGVSKVENPENFEEAMTRAQSASSNNEILIEEYIEGQEVSIETISFHGEHYILTITDKETTGSPHFVETAHHQPSMLPAEIQEKLRFATKDILNAIGINNGASHSEFKIDSNGSVYFIEVGARGGGDFISYDLVKLSTGYDYVKGMIEVALNDFHLPVHLFQKYAGVYFLSKEVAYIKEFINKNKKAEWVVANHIDEGTLQNLNKSQDRSGYIIYQSDHKISIPQHIKKK